LTISPSNRFSSLVIARTKRQPVQTLPVYELKITLRGSNPAIWRRVQVPGSIQLNRLHDVFQVVMGWTDSHLHQFIDAPIVYSVPSGDDYSRVERLDERRFCLADILRQENAAFIYEYDFGDGWVHEVVVEKIRSADPKKKYAVCLDGENACPPEDCGGIWGYYELLKAVKNPKHKEHRQMLDWLGARFYPGQFDLQKLNATLRGLEI
jgi:Plasmid pRiA4b ORF-3-like protein